MKNKVLFNFECIKDRAKIEASWIKDRVITYAEVHEHNKVVDELAEPVEDTLKAFEIIKNKRVDLSYLRCCIEDNQTVSRYNEYIRNKTMDYDHEEELTEEEFNLLKKTLLNSIAPKTQ